MANITYQLRAEYVGAYTGGVVRVADDRSYDVGAALVAGSGTITVPDSDQRLVDALDAYWALQRTGSVSAPAVPPPPTTLRRMRLGRGASPGETVLQAGRDTDPYNRFELDVDGNIKTGSGAAAPSPFSPGSGSPYRTPQVFIGDRTAPAVKIVGQGQKIVRDDFDKTVMATPPTVTIGTGAGSPPASSIASAQGIARTDARLRYLGANPVDTTVGGTSYLRPNNITSVIYGAQPWSVTFMTDADVFEFRTVGTGGKFKIRVDGAPVASGYTNGPTNDGLHYLIKCQFAGVATRRITIELTWNQYLATIFIGPVRSLWPVAHRKGPRWIWLGDSYTEPTGATAYEGLAQVASRLLGIEDAWSSGKGGTGVSEAPTFASRVNADVIAYNPEVVVIQDQNSTTAAATQQADAAALMDTLIAALPNARFVAIGGVAVQNSQAAGFQAVNAALRTTYEGKGAVFVDPSATPWVSGAGNSSALAGTGNADVMTGPDAAHPTVAGHDYIGRRIAAELTPFFPIAA